MAKTVREKIVVLTHGRARSKINTVIYYSPTEVNISSTAADFKPKSGPVGTRSKFTSIEMNIYRGDIYRGRTMDRSLLRYSFRTAVDRRK